MSIIQKINSDNEAGCSGEKMASTQSIETPVQNKSIPFSLIGVISKNYIANLRQKRQRMFARQQEILAQSSMEAML